MKHIHIILIISIILSHSTRAQVGTGEWRMHSESSFAKDVAYIGNSVFFAFDAAILEYDVKYKEYSTWDVTNSLSDIKLSKLGVHQASNSLFVGYENGNIDQIISGKTINIPGVKLAQITGNKKIFSIKSKDSYVYMATGFGIIKVDPYRNEIKDTYYPGNSLEEIVEITFKDDSIYALTNTKLYSGYLLNPALADPNQWTIDTLLPVLSSLDNFYYSDIEFWNNHFYYVKKYNMWAHDSVFVINNFGHQQAVDLQMYAEINSLQVVDNKLYIHSYDFSTILNVDNTVSYDVYPCNGEGWLRPMSLAFFDNSYWIADGIYGAMKKDTYGNCELLPFSGPKRNQFFFMDWSDGVLAVVPGSYSGIIQFWHQPGVMFLEDEKWKTISHNNNPLWNVGKTWDISSVSINPKNKNMIALSGSSLTPISIVNRETGLVVDTFSSYNSTLTRYVNNSSYVSSVLYDDDENLWVVNSLSDDLLKMKDVNGQWYSFNLGISTVGKRTGKMLYDYNGNIWLSVGGVGLVGYHPGSSITSSADDKKIILNTNDYSGALPSSNVTAIAMDFDKELWIGTDDGFAILYNSDKVFDASPGTYNVQRPKIEINGEVDYILSGVNITDIEIDGANRKWIATATSGMILLSEDGMSIVKHFTTDNSPLISNYIQDLEIDHNTGEIFIVTDRGLMSYRGDATYEDPNYSDVKVFPNPARPDFDGLITIQGIKYNSDVKITDVAGNVVYQTSSNGGTATWNGKTVHGEKVASGVYLIWTASNLEKGRYVGKVVVIN